MEQSGESRDSHEDVMTAAHLVTSRGVTHPPLARVLFRIHRACREFGPLIIW